MSRFWILCGSTFCFTGYFPVAPATFASAIVLGIWLILPPLSFPATILLLLALALGGTWLADRGERFLGHDAHPIVIDEVLGMWLTLAFLGHDWRMGLAGFALFRVYDVVKPPPAYQLQSLRGGFGIMADDVMAGIYGNLTLRLLHAIWPRLLPLG